MKVLSQWWTRQNPFQDVNLCLKVINQQQVAMAGVYSSLFVVAVGKAANARADA
jgi:hypothetical protein